MFSAYKSTVSYTISLFFVSCSVVVQARPRPQATKAGLVHGCAAKVVLALMASRPANLSAAAREAPGPESQATANTLCQANPHTNEQDNDNSNTSEATKRRRLQQALAEAAQTETPYGCLGSTFEIGGLTVPFVNPIALLWVLCHGTVHYMRFLSDCLRGSRGRIILYTDEVIPGNNLRPDHARGYSAFYWTIMEYPDWFRSRHCGWHDLFQVRTADVKEIVGGLSALTTHAMQLFWDPEGWDLQRLGLPLEGPLGRMHIHLDFGGFLMDERGEKYVTGVKGSAGSKPCISCMDCVGRIDPSLVPEGLKHYTTPGLREFQEHTYETFCAQLDYLRAQHGRVSTASFNEMQQALGIKYDPAALPYSCMREVARIPETRICDWMHNLVASGGVAQYQCNQFCLALDGHENFSLAALDEFTSSVKFPRGREKLGRGFFQQRVVVGPKACLRGFAGEVLTAFCVLGLFCELVLLPSGQLPEHASLIVLMCEILELLQMSDAAVPHAGRLEDLMEQYHREYMVVMPQCRKPKLHYMHHTPRQMRKFGKCVSCFAPERYHRMNKGWLNHIYRHMEVALAVRNADDLVNHMKQASSFEPIHLVGALRAINGRDVAADLLVRAGVDIGQTTKALRVQTTKGMLHNGDVMMWSEAGVRHLGACKGFYALGDRHAAHVEECVERPVGWTWGHISMLVNLNFLEAPITYLLDRDGSEEVVRPYVPKWH